MLKNFFWLLFLPVFLFSSNQWEFHEDKHQLLYQGQVFPIYQNVVTPIGYFGFERFGQNPFYKYGWFKMKQTESQFETGENLSEESLKKGWAISIKKPANLPPEWIYFPKTFLWSSTQSFLKLNKFWNTFYEKITSLSSDIYNEIKPNEFYRITTPYLTSDIRDIKAFYPENLILVFEKKLTNYGNRKLFIFYSIKNPDKTSSTVHKIDIEQTTNEGYKINKIYKLIYQKDSRLME